MARTQLNNAQNPTERNKQEYLKKKKEKKDKTPETILIRVQCNYHKDTHCKDAHFIVYKGRSIEKCMNKMKISRNENISTNQITELKNTII